MNRSLLLLLPVIALASCSDASTSALRLARRASRAVGALVTSAPSYAYTYDPTGLVTSVASNGDGAAPVPLYPRDALGRATQKGNLALTYGPDGHLAGATSPSGVNVAYLYDEEGQRIAKSSGGTLVEAYLPEGLVTATTLVEHVEAAGRTVGVLKNGAFESVALDSRGSALASTDGDTMLPSPYGARAVHPDVAPAIDYTKHGYDADLDAVRMGVRDYDAETARFLEPDPLFLAKPERCLKSPVECNLYGYAKGSPITYIDPDGRKIELASGVSDAFKKDYAAAMAYLNKSPSAAAFLKTVQEDSHTVVIRPLQASEASIGPNFHTAPKYIFFTKYEISWDPHYGVTPTEGGAISPALALLHEANHAYERMTNNKAYQADVGKTDPSFDNLEEKRNITGVENKAAGELGETLRVSHHGSKLTVSDPTKTK